MKPPFTPYTGDTPFVFVCYSHADAHRVYPELLRLRDAGLDIWYDEGVEAGSEWQESIAERIDSCRAFLFFVSPRSVASTHCRRELTYAQARDRKVIAVHLEPTELSSGMQLSLGDRQAVLRHELTEDAYREKLRAALTDAPPRARAERVLLMKKPDRLRWAFVAGIAALITVALWLVRPLPQDDLDGTALLILPFENLSPEETNAYFAAGLHEDLLTGLSRIPDLVVISKTTAKHLAASSLSLAEMAAQVDATHVLEGSARRDEQRVRISVTLVEAAKDRQVWSNSYDVELQEVIATQAALAEQIANQLRLRLDDDLLASFAQAPTTSLDAYDLYLRALSLRRGANMSDGQKSIALLEKAVALDPDYSEAWARLGSFTDTLKRVQRLPWADYRDEVMAPLRRAYAIDPDNPVVLSLLGQTLAVNGERLSEAGAYLAKALELAPSDAEAHKAYGQYLQASAGPIPSAGPNPLDVETREKLEDALSHYRTAFRLDPYGHTAWPVVGALAWLRRYDEAVQFGLQVLENQPENGAVHALVSNVAYFSNVDPFAALTHAYDAVRLSGPGNVLFGTHLVHMLSDFGEHDAASAWLDWLEQHQVRPNPRLETFRLRNAVNAGRSSDLRELAATDGTIAVTPDPRSALDRRRLAGPAHFLGAQEARRAGEAALFEDRLNRALAAFGAADDEQPWGTKVGAVCMDFQWMLFYTVAARQAARPALAEALIERINECTAFSADRSASGDAGFYATRAIWAALNGDLEEASWSLEQAACCASYVVLLQACGVLEDLGGTFHGVRDHPQFRKQVAEATQEISQLGQRIRTEAPWLLTPPEGTAPRVPADNL